jgi:hypothetical protein
MEAPSRRSHAQHMLQFAPEDQPLDSRYADKGGERPPQNSAVDPIVRAQVPLGLPLPRHSRLVDIHEARMQ